MCYVQYNFLIFNKLNIHTEKGVFLSCGMQQFSKFISNIFRDRWVNTSAFTWEIFVIYEPSYGNLFSFVVLFAMERSYQLSLNPTSDNVVENSSYHNRALSIIPWIAFMICTYRNFSPFSYVINFPYSGFTSHIMSKTSPSHFICAILSS